MKDEKFMEKISHIKMKNNNELDGDDAMKNPFLVFFVYQ